VTDHPSAEIKAAIISEAKILGFDDIRITSATLPAQVGAALDRFVELGHHGDMAWLAGRREQRRSPNGLWPEAHSVIMLAMSYAPDHDPRDMLASKSLGNISVYARGDDYHDVIKKKLKAIGRFMAQHFNCALKVFVDTAPVMEKPLGQQAGLGWQGKHTNLLSRRLGNWFFLGAIYTDLDLTPDAPEIDHCGSCSACMDACPTQAFPGPYQLDARRCISYLTIEYAGPWPHEFRHAMGNRIYGCDDCLAACPWNKFARDASEAKLKARDNLQAPKLADLLQLDDAAFRALFSKSPIKRIGVNRFLRNCLYAAGNSNDINLISYVQALYDHPDTVVADAATWAHKKLSQG